MERDIWGNENTMAPIGPMGSLCGGFGVRFGGERGGGALRTMGPLGSFGTDCWTDVEAPCDPWPRPSQGQAKARPRPGQGQAKAGPKARPLGKVPADQGRAHNPHLQTTPHCPAAARTHRTKFPCAPGPVPEGLALAFKTCLDQPWPNLGRKHNVSLSISLSLSLSL